MQRPKRCKANGNIFSLCQSCRPALADFCDPIKAKHQDCLKHISRSVMGQNSSKFSSSKTLPGLTRKKMMKYLPKLVNIFTLHS